MRGGILHQDGKVRWIHFCESYSTFIIYWFRSLTKGRVVGVDISQEMLDLAKGQSDQEIEFILGDCSQDLKIGGNFEIATATFLLNLSQTRETMKSFCRTAFNVLVSFKSKKFFPGILETVFETTLNSRLLKAVSSVSPSTPSSRTWRP